MERFKIHNKDIGENGKTILATEVMFKTLNKKGWVKVSDGAKEPLTKKKEDIKEVLDKVEEPKKEESNPELKKATDFTSIQKAKDYLKEMEDKGVKVDLKDFIEGDDRSGIKNLIK